MFVGREHVLLIEKNRPEWQAGMLNGIGGKIKENETAAQAMVRKFQEETGTPTRISEWSRRICLFGQSWQVQFFSAHRDSFYYEQTTDEKPVIVRLASLPDTVVPNLKWMIPLILDKKVQFPIKIGNLDA